MSERYAELREAIPDATPGPWRHGPLFWEGWAETADGGGVRVFEVPHVYPNGARQPGVFVDPEIGRDRERDARDIAAADPFVIATLLAERDALVEALRLAHDVIRRTRDHLSTDHPECVYTVLGIFNDARVRVLLGEES